MIHKWMRNYDINGVWTKSQRKINVDGVEHDLDEYAKQHGIDLPDGKKSKKQINTDIEEKHEDMEHSLDSGDIEIDGDGDSESTE